MTPAAIVALMLLGVIWLFQIALALGVPWGAAAWGGQHSGVLPKTLRLGSAIAAVVLYPLIVLYVLASIDVVELAWLPGAGSRALWVLTGVFTLGALMNFISRSSIERIWGPVALAIAVCCGLLAAGL